MSSFEYDIDYSKGENSNDGLKDKFKTIAECVCHCRKKGLLYFTWNSAELNHPLFECPHCVHACWCKYGSAGRRIIEGSVSGKVNDAGMVNFQVIILIVLLLILLIVLFLFLLYPNSLENIFRHHVLKH